MTTFLIILASLVWIACGVISRGYRVGFLAYEYPSFPQFGGWDIPLGPFALISTAIVLNFRHWRWDVPTKEEAWQAHQAKWPGLSYSDFEQTWNELS